MSTAAVFLEDLRGDTAPVPAQLGCNGPAGLLSLMLDSSGRWPADLSATAAEVMATLEPDKHYPGAVKLHLKDGVRARRPRWPYRGLHTVNATMHIIAAPWTSVTVLTPRFSELRAILRRRRCAARPPRRTGKPSSVPTQFCRAKCPGPSSCFKSSLTRPKPRE